MGKKTKEQKEKIRWNLDLQMNLPSDIASRNPRIEAFLKKYGARYPRDEYDKLFKEIYGEVFPRFPFPVLPIDSVRKKPSELVLSIDLNYTKEEIMFVLEKCIDVEHAKYRKDHKTKVKRKHLKKWVDYLEIWDLKNGDPPWVKVGNTKLPFVQKKKKGRPWTYEQIAKYLYPKAQTSEELSTAIDKAKKDYRAAYKLICGETCTAQSTDQEDFCDNCHDRHCKETGEACPRLVQHLEGLEVAQQHLLVGDPKQGDIDQFKKSRKRPSADDQFK